VSLWIIFAAVRRRYCCSTRSVFAVERVPIRAISMSFSQALQSSETLRAVYCGSHMALGSQRTSGLCVCCKAGSRDFHPFQALADVVNNAQSLCDLLVVLCVEHFPRDSSGLAALANAVREHTEFRLYDWFTLPGTAQSTSLDPLLLALSACPHLREVVIETESASANAIRNLLQYSCSRPQSCI
jgi:hypothetical protein